MSRKGKVTLLSGISGSGKTHYSRSLASRGAVRLSVDEMMWERYGRFMAMESSEQRRLTLATEEEMRRLMASLLREGRDVVIDSCLCKRFKREAFESEALACGAEVEKLYLTAPKDVLLSRLSQRKGENANDIRVSVEEFERFEGNFEVPSEDEGYRIVESV